MSGNDEWGIWEGIEVEGDYYGIRTLFLYSMPEGMDDPSFLFPGYPHIWYCWQWLDRYGDLSIRNALASGALVSLEIPVGKRANIPVDIMTRCHIMLAIPIDLPEWLKPSDTIRLTSSVDFLSCGIRNRQLWRVAPEDYLNDKLLYAASPGQKRK